MTLAETLILLGGALAVCVIMNVLGRRPVQFGKTRLFPYLGVQFIAFALAMYLAAHLLTLLKAQ